MERRKFLKGVGVAVGVAGTSQLLGACQAAVVYNKAPVNEHNELVMSKAEFAGKSQVLIEHPETRFPISVFKTGNDQYSACLMSCTHQRCQTSLVADEYVCPCHGARFGKEGKVIKGPAEQDLVSYKITVTKESIFIALD